VSRRSLLVLAVVLIFGVLIALTIFYVGRIARMSPSPIIREYHVVVEPMESGRFKIREDIIIELRDVLSSTTEIKELAFSLPEREVASTSRGLLLNEIYIAPLQVSDSGYVSLTLQDGRAMDVLLCTFYCPKTNIEVRDLPKGSFYAAKESQDVKAYPYIDTETVSWSVRDLQEGITFAYVMPPFQQLRPAVDPLIGASSLSHLVVGVIGIALAIIVGPVVKPVVLDIFRDRLKARFVDRSPQQPAKKVKLIISSKGDEKEVKTKK
jgi:hypothetical protein